MSPIGYIARILPALLLAASAQAAVVEEQTKVAVKVLDGFGKEVAHEIVVTLFHDTAAPRPYPALVLNHGRAAKAEGRAALGRARYSEISDWLARQGFLVAVPTRVGYGVTAGDDVEDTGDCNRKRYPPGYLASAVQTLKVLEMLRARPDVAADRAVIMGQSFGGTNAVTIASMNPPGVQATINFAGGGGGRPDTHPGNPCSQAQMKKLFAEYGTSARIPVLWAYTENDQYWGPALPKEWFDAFRAAGGIGEYTQFPPNGRDGHTLFSAAPAVWEARVVEFLRANGYPGVKALGFRGTRR